MGVGAAAGQRLGGVEQAAFCDRSQGGRLSLTSSANGLLYMSVCCPLFPGYSWVSLPCIHVMVSLLAGEVLATGGQVKQAMLHLGAAQAALEVSGCARQPLGAGLLLGTVLGAVLSASVTAPAPAFLRRKNQVVKLVGVARCWPARGRSSQAGDF